MGVREFQEKLRNDEAFAAKFADVTSIEELVELAAKEGFVFTAEEMKNSTELTEEELETAAGGASILVIGAYGRSVTAVAVPKTFFE